MYIYIYIYISICYIYIYIYIGDPLRFINLGAKGVAAKNFGSFSQAHVHPVRIVRFHVTRLSPRVGLPRNLFLIGSLTAALRFSPRVGSEKTRILDCELGVHACIHVGTLCYIMFNYSILSYIILR